MEICYDFFRGNYMYLSAFEMEYIVCWTWFVAKENETSGVKLDRRSRDLFTGPGRSWLKLMRESGLPPGTWINVAADIS